MQDKAVKGLAALVNAATSQLSLAFIWDAATNSHAFSQQFLDGSGSCVTGELPVLVSQSVSQSAWLSCSLRVTLHVCVSTYDGLRPVYGPPHEL